MKYTEQQAEQRRKAVAKYTESVDRVNCLLPAGTKERIKAVSGKSCNAFIKEAVLIQLEQLERLK